MIAELHELADDVQYPLDLAGIFAFAVHGALIATRKDFDFFGTLLLAESAGVGGGLFRDLVLRVQPVAFTDLGCAIAPFLATLLVFFSSRAQSWKRGWHVADAGALGMFCVTGTVKALDHGLNSPASAAIGVTTAVGGGVACSVLAREIPSSLAWDRDLYVVPALLGSGLVILLHATSTLRVATAVAAGLLAFAFRLSAVRRGWRTPRSALWRRAGAVPKSATLPDGRREKTMLPSADARTAQHRQVSSELH
ncbi:TRIC cation channel family protein [Streptomyces asoensis]|uniref:trimeric intracellular cation channel family protein n=1 Tax=Streptomyces asoensis TaxID=249586 RepID=UPI0033D4FB02